MMEREEGRRERRNLLSRKGENESRGERKNSLRKNKKGGRSDE